jgi:hypothetical protein
MSSCNLVAMVYQMPSVAVQPYGSVLRTEFVLVHSAKVL